MLSNFVSKHKKELENIALAVRLLSMDAVLKAKSGHIGLPLGGAEMGTLLYFAVMRHDPQNPQWINRDRFVLSAGHGSMLQYSLLHLSGYKLPKEEIIQFRQIGSLTPGHPEFGHTPGIECTTGPLGQGISHAVGMALAERMLAARFNHQQQQLIEHNTFVIAGDGCLMEGVSSETSSFAGHLKLNKLITLYDANNITIDGTIDIAFSENVAQRYEAYGWNVLSANGNDFDSLSQAMETALANAKRPQGETGPTLIICKTIPGKGATKWEGKPKIHGNPMSEDDVKEAKQHLGISNLEPFFIPDYCLVSAKKMMELRSEHVLDWKKSFEKIMQQWEIETPEKLKLWNLHFYSTKTINSKIHDDTWQSAKSKMATRVASGKALCALAASDPTLVGGSADLAGSNATTLPNTSFITATDFSGRNIHFGVREHGMAAICNGITLHGGLRAYCATFAVFSDYMRPAIRLAALMQIPTLFILTHDSYAVGEDGPTHQPIEHAASLRAIPNLNVIRPADAMETFAAWEFAVSSTSQPTALLLTRQDLNNLDELIDSPRTLKTINEGLVNGGYLVKDFNNTAHAQKIILIASGSEVGLALQTASLLEKQQNEKPISIRVVSAPISQRLPENPIWLNTFLPREIPIVAIEAGSPMGWGEIVGRDGLILGLKHFGESAPAQKLAQRFGFTPEKMTENILNFLKIR